MKKHMKNNDAQKKGSEDKKEFRQIIIETDGKKVVLRKAEVSGNIELIAILQIIINFLNEKGAAKKQ